MILIQYRGTLWVIFHLYPSKKSIFEGFCFFPAEKAAFPCTAVSQLSVKFDLKWRTSKCFCKSDDSVRSPNKLLYYKLQVDRYRYSFGSCWMNRLHSVILWWLNCCLDEFLLLYFLLASYSIAKDKIIIPCEWGFTSVLPVMQVSMKFSSWAGRTSHFIRVQVEWVSVSGTITCHQTTRAEWRADWNSEEHDISP